MRGRWLFTFATALTFISLLAVSCSTPAPQTTTAPAPPKSSAAVSTSAPAPKTSTAAPAKTVTLKFAGWTPAGASMSKSVDWYLTEAEKRSNGQIKIERYWSESLAPAAALIDALAGGIADLAMIYPTYYPGKLPLGTVSSLPFYLTPDVWTVRMAHNDLYAQVKEMRDEAAKYKTRYLSAFGGIAMYLIFSKDVKSVDQLAGLKIRATGEQAPLIKELGAVPVTIAAPDVYTACERKTVDGVVWNMPGISTFGVENVLHYYYKLPAGGPSMFIGMNEDSWNKLSPDLQKMLMDLAKEHAQVDHRIMQIEGEEGSDLAKFKAAGGVVNMPTAADNAKAQKIINDVVITKWINDQKAANRPGQMVFDTFASLIKKYEPSNPFKK